MQKTILNQPSTIGAATFYSYPCKFECECTRYDPALTLTDKRGVEFLNKCTHGGGIGCPSYRNRVRKEQGWYEPFKNRTGAKRVDA